MRFTLPSLNSSAVVVRKGFRTSDPYRVKETPSVTRGDGALLFPRFSIRPRTGASSPLRPRGMHGPVAGAAVAVHAASVAEQPTSCTSGPLASTTSC